MPPPAVPPLPAPLPPKVPFAKPALTFAQQIAKLQGEGMVIADPALAQHCLQHISYYRLSAYWLYFEHPKGQAGPRFQPGTTFEDVVALYEFDRALRLLVLDAVERIEVAVRGSWAYQHEIDSLIARLKARLLRADTRSRVLTHREADDEAELPPLEP